MRRKDREITDIKKMTEIMENCDCCRIGLIDHERDEAYIVPLNFGYDISEEQITLYFHGASAGRKIDLIPEQAKVSFEMDAKHSLCEGETGCKFSYFYQSIMGTGRLEVLENTQEKKIGLMKVMEHYTHETHWTFDDAVLARTAVLKLTVDQWSCKEH